MNVGIVCYASVGGSGVVATELAFELAARGHQVHLLSSDPPFRWRDGVPGLHFVRVETPAYPLFHEPQYLLALANTLVRVACDHDLDVIHAHYAVPHATAAYLADEILRREAGECRPRTVTTLHGTDITLIGSNPSYARVVAFSIEQSHAVTAVSESLKRDTLASIGASLDIRVIPNFLETSRYVRRLDPDFRRSIARDDEAIVLHTSNFRPVKRVSVVFEVFRRIRARRPARLVLVGDGPDRAGLEREVAASRSARDVLFAGEQRDLVPWLSMADVFLLPSSQESFGLAALEAMACAVPVVVSRVGGLPEVIDDGDTGFLCEMHDVQGMAERALEVLGDAEAAGRIGRAAAAAVRERFSVAKVVPRYEALYEETLALRDSQPSSRAAQDVPANRA
jgi:N-acetyl-alpha-D-glucosaminyl L-malate synthase BshA